MTVISLWTRPAATDSCCVPGTTAPLPLDEAERLAALLKAVADPTRLRLLSLLAQASDAERCICDLTAPVGLSQPTVSHHMKILVEAGLLTREQRSKWAYYRLVDGAAEALTTALLAVVSPPGATTLTP
ncbi:ArsR/SmtB family transcription factor [uncultured Friedmanniella sp.]|uniref:ArsR/SmtB family transcription factor n=1 Tax=uncultured Friedmanniella sp. TaxID=335381 RepID=UPI0035CB8D84